jgi:hypothetical protein
MQNETPATPTLDRRGFIKAAGGVALLAALPGALSAAAGVAGKPVILAFVGLTTVARFISFHYELTYFISD